MQEPDYANIDKVLLEPRKYFASPEAVVENDRLNLKEKTSILQSWEMDERVRAVAAEEGMTGADQSDLARIRRALNDLTAGIPDEGAGDVPRRPDAERPSNSKLGDVPKG